MAKVSKVVQHNHRKVRLRRQGPAASHRTMEETVQHVKVVGRDGTCSFIDRCSYWYREDPAIMSNGLALHVFLCLQSYSSMLHAHSLVEPQMDTAWAWMTGSRYSLARNTSPKCAYHSFAQPCFSWSCTSQSPTTSLRAGISSAETTLQYKDYGRDRQATHRLPDGDIYRN
jgi:hypothetical protein